jgi:hypothetical protein
MLGSTTTPGRGCSRDCEHLRVAFRSYHGVGARKVFYEAQWPAYACPDRRFADILTDAAARLGVDMTRWVFIVGDFHSIFLAGLPAHGKFSLERTVLRLHICICTLSAGRVRDPRAEKRVLT